MYGYIKRPHMWPACDNPELSQAIPSH